MLLLLSLLSRLQLFYYFHYFNWCYNEQNYIYHHQYVNSKYNCSVHKPTQDLRISQKRTFWNSASLRPYLVPKCESSKPVVVASLGKKILWKFSNARETVSLCVQSLNPKTNPLTWCWGKYVTMPGYTVHLKACQSTFITHRTARLTFVTVSLLTRTFRGAKCNSFHPTSIGSRWMTTNLAPPISLKCFNLSSSAFPGWGLS